MTEIIVGSVAAGCAFVAALAIVMFERSIRRSAEARVASVQEWARRSVDDARADAEKTRVWFSEELRIAREETQRLTRQVESRNLAEFASAEEQLARSRGVLPTPPPRKPSALDEMWGDKPPVDSGRKDVKS